MDLALYDNRFGYYARAAQRSGRAGDFLTSVDVGPLFGELLETQLAEMFAIVKSQSSIHHFDVVEAGAGNGRLSADILRAARQKHPAFYHAIRLHLVEASKEARASQPGTLGEVAERLASSTDGLPDRVEGVIFANELLDAVPTHQVVMRETGLREVYVDANPSDPARLIAREGAVSTPRLASYLEDLGVALEPGWRVEINLRAVEWIRDAARHLQHGFMILIDYGHSARDLYSASHSGGTLTTFSGHTMAGPEVSTDSPPWLCDPGNRDITSHVDFTSVRAAAEAEGLTTIAFLDQTYFLMGLLGSGGSTGSTGSTDSTDSTGPGGSSENPLNLLHPLNRLKLSERLALKTLVMPGGLGSTFKVMILGKGVGTPALAGCSYRVRVT